MKRLFAAVTAVSCMLALASCGSGESASSAPDSASKSPVISADPVLEVELDKLLTPAQISQSVGAEVGEPQVFEDGTWVRYSSEDFKTTVDINMQDATQELFDTYIELYYPDAEDDAEMEAPAKWSSAAEELVTLAKGYMIGVKVSIPGAEEARLQQSARELMTALIQAIPA